MFRLFLEAPPRFYEGVEYTLNCAGEASGFGNWRSSRFEASLNGLSRVFLLFFFFFLLGGGFYEAFRFPSFCFSALALLRVQDLGFTCLTQNPKTLNPRHLNHQPGIGVQV